MTTNTHIAAQARTRAESLESTSGCTDADQVSIELAADVLRQCAQALEAAPALDAQGEAAELLNWFTEADGFSQGTKAPHKWVLRAEQELRRLSSVPPPPAVGKPLSEEQKRDLLSAAFYIAARDDDTATLKESDAERIVELLTELSGIDLSGIVTKETGT